MASRIGRPRGAEGVREATLVDRIAWPKFNLQDLLAQVIVDLAGDVLLSIEHGSRPNVLKRMPGPCESL